MDLEELQRAVLGVIQQPLTPSEGMRKRTLDGRPVKKIVDEIVKPNDRLTSFERLEIYNRVYWFRIISSLADDFPGLRAVIGQRNFDKLIRAYLLECPSESFSLRNLGSRLESWLRRHPRFAPQRHRMALDMVRLEWADIEAFDGAELPRLTEADLANLGEDPIFHLQPNLRLLDLAYPVNDLLLRVREEDEEEADIASNVVLEREPKKQKKRVPLPRPKKVYLAVYRLEMVVYFKRLEAESFALLRALQQGKHLSQAIEESVNWSHGDIAQVTGNLRGWFANWSSLGWFCHQEKAAKVQKTAEAEKAKHA
jgi:hypothetical protein